MFTFVNRLRIYIDYKEHLWNYLRQKLLKNISEITNFRIDISFHSTVDIFFELCDDIHISWKKAK